MGIRVHKVLGYGLDDVKAEPQQKEQQSCLLTRQSKAARNIVDPTTEQQASIALVVQAAAAPGAKATAFTLITNTGPLPMNRSKNGRRA